MQKFKDICRTQLGMKNSGPALVNLVEQFNAEHTAGGAGSTLSAEVEYHNLQTQLEPLVKDRDSIRAILKNHDNRDTFSDVANKEYHMDFKKPDTWKPRMARMIADYDQGKIKSLESETPEDFQLFISLIEVDIKIHDVTSRLVIVRRNLYGAALPKDPEAATENDPASAADTLSKPADIEQPKEPPHEDTKLEHEHEDSAYYKDDDDDDDVDEQKQSEYLGEDDEEEEW